MKGAVLFDLFGTLVPSPPKSGYREVVDEISKLLGLPREEFFEAWMGVNDHRLNGTFGSSEGEIAHVAGLFGATISQSQMEHCVQLRRKAMREWLAPKDGTLELLDELIKSGYRLALVSDCVFDVPASWDLTPMASRIPVKAFSCELGLRKPDPRMYRTALEQLRVVPSEALFVGDGGSNELAGAEAIGMFALLLDDQPADQSTVLRVDVHEWNGPSVKNISDVLAEASSRFATRPSPH